MRQRLVLLVTVVTIALTAAACGRATEDQINQALGITPTPTPSEAQMASATAAASATSAARLLAASTPGAVALGDVVQGKRQFDTWCVGCHGPGGVGPDILSPGSPGTAITADALLPLVRDATGHSTPPGPYRSTEITDKQVTDVAAYLQSEAGQ